MANNMNYFVNPKTRMRMILGGRGEEHDLEVKKAMKDGYVEVTADQQDLFGDNTYKMISAGWNRSPRTLKKYIHLIEVEVF